MFSHIATVAPCIFLGGFLLFARKGTKLHRSMGLIYMTLMMITAVLSLFLPAMVGDRFLNHFGWIHLLSFLVLYTVPTALIAVRKGQVKKHQRKMVLLYIGALLIAGGFTLTPGRYMHELVFG